jgi:hypothetical protein
VYVLARSSGQIREGIVMSARSLASTRSWRSVLAGAFAFVLVAIAGPAFAAPSAQAATPTINCDSVAQPSSSWTTCQQLVGTASCAWNNRNGTWTLAVGYTNPTASILTASIPPAPGGANNAFTATSGFASNPGHPTTFQPGTYVTAFTVTWTPSSKSDPVTWVLMGHTFTWTETSVPACPKTPVPVAGSIAGIFGFLALVMIWFAVANRRATSAYRAVLARRRSSLPPPQPALAT